MGRPHRLRARGIVHRDTPGFQAETQAFEVGDGLLEDVAEDVHVNDRPDFSALALHSRHATPPERAVQRIGGSLAFEDRHELFFVLVEATRHSIGDLAVHLDVEFAGKGEGVCRSVITRYIVEQALGSVLKQRFETLRQQHEAEAAGTATTTSKPPWAKTSGNSACQWT